MHTTFANGTNVQQPITLEKLMAVHKAAKELVSKPPMWVVVDPHGTVHVGTVDQMLSLLASAHPVNSFTTMKEQGL